MKKITIIFLFAILLVSTPFFFPRLNVFATSYTATIGEKQLVYTANPTIKPYETPDGPYHVHVDLQNRLRGIFSPTQQTKANINPFSLNLNINQTENLSGLGPGTAIFDSNNSWLYSIFQGQTELFGFYHAEPRDNWPYIKSSIAYTYFDQNLNKWIKGVKGMPQFSYPKMKFLLFQLTAQFLLQATIT